MKAVLGSIALTTLSTAVSAVPHGRNDPAPLVERAAAPVFESTHPRNLQARQLGLPTGGPPAPPDTLPYAFGLSSEAVSQLKSSYFVNVPTAFQIPSLHPSPTVAMPGRMLSTELLPSLAR